MGGKSVNFLASFVMVSVLIYLELDDIGKCDRQESLKKMYRKHVFLKFLCDHFFELECKSLICVLSSAHCEH